MKKTFVYNLPDDIDVYEKDGWIMFDVSRSNGSNKIKTTVITLDVKDEPERESVHRHTGEECSSSDVERFGVEPKDGDTYHDMGHSCVYVEAEHRWIQLW